MIRPPAIVAWFSSALASLPMAFLAGHSLAQAPVWRELTHSTFGGCQAVWDSARQRLVAVTGGRTFEWDGLDWRLRATPTATPMHNAGRICYDDARRVTLLFGGQPSAPGGAVGLFDNSLWQYDGSDWRQVASGGPPPRISAAMAFDRARARMVLFGGTGNAGSLGDTWEWDGVSWLQRQVPGPGVRTGHSLAYDSSTSRTILFGGFNSLASVVAETWAWDGVTWTQLQPATTPPPRAFGGLAADPASGRLVLFSGGNSTTTLVDLWEWNGANWLAQPPFPGVFRSNFGMAVDASGRTFVVGGASSAPPGQIAEPTVGDTWIYPGGGGSWQQVGVGGPPWRDQARLVHDTVRGRLVLVGGGAGPFSPTWEWANGVWTQATPVNNLPLSLGTRFCFDIVRGVTVAFGGLRGLAVNAETREWDGVDWVQRQVTGPAPRWQHHLVYDELRAQVVLFGGSGPADTWTYDGTAWTLAATTGPSARRQGAMAYDAGRGRVVLFGGIDLSVGVVNDTWEWDGTVWAMANPPQSPPGRSAAAFAYDRVRQRMVLVGGLVPTTGGVIPARDQWLWDGVNWIGGPANVPIDVRSLADSLSMTWFDPLSALVLMTPRPGVASNDFWLGAPNLATAEPGGPGCVAATAPALRTFGVPRVGDSAFAFEVVGAAANTMTWIGLSDTNGTYALGAGCTLYLQSPYASVSLMTNAAGFAVRPFPVPNSPLLLGIASTVQAASLDSSSLLGYVVTGAVALRVGG